MRLTHHLEDGDKSHIVAVMSNTWFDVSIAK